MGFNSAFKGLILFNYTLQPFKAYFALWVRRSNFHHQASPRVSLRQSTKQRKVELWTRNVREFCLIADFHITFRDLLHAVKLRHGTDGFTSLPKEGVLRNFFALKIRRLRPGANLRTWVPKVSTTEAANLGYLLTSVRIFRHSVSSSEPTKKGCKLLLVVSSRQQRSVL
jgi:hypothetical protein